jgi:hypothetical protein
MRVLVDICMEVCVDGGLVQLRAVPRATGQSNAGGQESVGLVYLRTSCSTLHLVVFIHSSTPTSQLSDLQWPGTIIFGSSKEFGPSGPDGWAGLDRCQIRTTLSTLCPCRRWEEC